jgi:hypothetical protein
VGGFGPAFPEVFCVLLFGPTFSHACFIDPTRAMVAVAWGLCAQSGNGRKIVLRAGNEFVDVMASGG